MYRPIGDGYGFSYFRSGTGNARWRRMTILERFKLWRRRRKSDDLSGLRGWIA
jgi:hypothetical protein